MTVVHYHWLLSLVFSVFSSNFWRIIWFKDEFWQYLRQRRKLPKEERKKNFRSRREDKLLKKLWYNLSWLWRDLVQTVVWCFSFMVWFRCILAHYKRKIDIFFRYSYFLWDFGCFEDLETKDWRPRIIEDQFSYVTHVSFFKSFDYE